MVNSAATLDCRLVGNDSDRHRRPQVLDLLHPAQALGRLQQGLVEMMEEQGVVSQANHVGKREVLVRER